MFAVNNNHFLPIFCDIWEKKKKNLHRPENCNCCIRATWIKCRTCLETDCFLLFQLFVGLSFPYEGPAPLEAIANGCAFLNPKFTPPKSSKNTDFFKGKPTLREVSGLVCTVQWPVSGFSSSPLLSLPQLTSQHPYAEVYIGRPHVWTVDIENSAEVERALRSILSQKVGEQTPCVVELWNKTKALFWSEAFRMVWAAAHFFNIQTQICPGYLELMCFVVFCGQIEPYLPYEFTCEGMLQRVNAFIENQVQTP